MNCGTYAGYSRHVRHGEKPCDPCRLANNQYHQQLRQLDGASRRVEAHDFRLARIGGDLCLVWVT